MGQGDVRRSVHEFKHRPAVPRVPRQPGPANRASLCLWQGAGRTGVTTQDNDYDVLVCGLGPVGLLCTVLLGQAGLRVAGFDGDAPGRMRLVEDQVDGHAMRILARAGCFGRLEAHCVSADRIRFVDGARQPLLTLQLAPRGQAVSGFSPLNFCPPERLGEALRARAGELAGVEIHYGQALTAFRAGDASVECTIRGAAQGERRVTARYLLGCDGSESRVRTELGVQVSRVEELGWLLLDTRAREFRAEAGVPEYILDSRWPARHTPGAESTRRYTVPVRSEDDPDTLEQPWRGREILARYEGPPGSDILGQRYVRRRVGVAVQRRVGRVLLAGASACELPPVTGQALSEALRDAANLCWKLRLVLRAGASQALLDTYSEERGAQARRAIQREYRIGRLLLSGSSWYPRMRALLFRVLNLVRWLRGPLHRVPMRTVVPYRNGLFDLESSHLAGRYLPQVEVHDGAGDRGRLDTFIGSGFVLLAVNRDPKSSVPVTRYPALERLSTVYVNLCRSAREAGSCQPGVRTLVDEQGVLHALFRRHAVDFILVRPDACIYGACREEALQTMLTGLLGELGMAVEPPNTAAGDS